MALWLNLMSLLVLLRGVQSDVQFVTSGVEVTTPDESSEPSFWSYLQRFLEQLDVHSVQIVESGPGSVSPGGSFRLTCNVTGKSVDHIYLAWIRQAPGKGLEWVGGRIWDDNNENWITAYASSLQSRTNLTVDESRNECYLTMNSLTTADSATYYCAVKSQ